MAELLKLSTMASLRTFLSGALIALSMTACEKQTVVPVAVASMTITPSSFRLVEGESQVAQATPLGPEGEVLSGRSIMWSSDAPGIASVDASGTIEGVKAGETTIQATAEGVTGSAPVTVLPGPSIELSRTAVSLTAVSGGNSATQTVTVGNGGNGVLSGLSVSIAYGAQGPSGWLTASLDGTTAPAQLSIAASAATLGAGSYEATVTVQSPVGSGLSAQVAVTLEVAPPPPAIALGSQTISFAATAGGQRPAVQDISVTNSGGGVLQALSDSVSYTAGEPEGWLAASLSASVAPATLTLEASPLTLQPGQYHAQVEVRSTVASNSPQTVTVQFNVTAAASGQAPARTVGASTRPGAGTHVGGREPHP